MFLILITFVGLSLSVFTNLNADYTLSFNNSDLYFLKRMIRLSDSQDLNCDHKSRKEALDAFIHYGYRKEWTRKTQFAKGTGYGSYSVIKLDPKMFDSDPDHELTISFFPKNRFNYSVMMSPGLKNLAAKIITDSKN